MYLPTQMDVTFSRVERLRCSIADLRRLALQKDVWARALPWLAIERFRGEPSGALEAEGVVRRGPFRFHVRIEGRLDEIDDGLTLHLHGTLHHAIRLSAHATAAPEGRGSSLRCALRIDRVPQAVHAALAAAEHRAVRVAVAAVEAICAKARDRGRGAGRPAI